MVHRPFQDWDSLKASFRRARAELTVREFGIKELLERRMVYQKIKIRSLAGGTIAPSRESTGLILIGPWFLLGAEGYLALAMRDYELRSYSGNATLFIAQDEPGSDAEPARAWAGKILGGCETRLVPGTHRTILTRPQVNFTRPGDQAEAGAKCGVSRE